MYKDEDIEEIAGAVVELGELAMAFGRINRTGPQHPTGEPESDADHTVMLAWIAPALADLINKDVGYARHNICRVSMYASVHDAVEVYAGDTPTVRITAQELTDKAAREAVAAQRLFGQFSSRLPWFAQMVRNYEAQQDHDARLVRSIDKLMPKVVHLICQGQDLIRSGFSRQDFQDVVTRQRRQIKEWSNDQLLLRLYDVMCLRVWEAWPSPVRPQPHRFVVVDGKPGLAGHTPECFAGCPIQEVFDKWVAWNTLPLNDGEYPVDINADGFLTFVGKQD